MNVRSAQRHVLHAIQIAVVACVVALWTSPSAAQIAHTPRELQHVGVNEHLDGPLPLDAQFKDHTGKPVRFGALFDGKRPVVLQFAYHTCPVVCSMITNNLAAGLRGVPWTIGKEFDVVTISIDPNESLERTANKRTSILTEYGRPETQAGGGWHFLVGDEKAIASVADAAGFEYQYDERQKQWGHPSVVFIVKPNGHIARYLYGLEFPSADLRLGLLEASEGRHISTVEQIILFCYHYDPQGGKYVLVAQRVMQVGGAAIALVLFTFLGLLWLREFKKKRGGPSSDDPSDTPTNSRASADGEAASREAGSTLESSRARGAARGFGRSPNMTDDSTVPVRGG